MKVAISYARCSTKKQDLDSQNSRLNTWALNFDKHQHYEDLAVSGKKDSREGIDALLDYARKLNVKEYDEVLVGVVELSRIGRSIGFITNTIKELRELGMKIVLVNTNTTIDYNSLEGSAMINALAMASDIEWRLIKDRNERGREKIKQDNIKVGRKHKEVSDTAINALKEKGLSLREIAKELGVSAPTIMRRLNGVT